MRIQVNTQLNHKHIATTRIYIFFDIKPYNEEKEVTASIIRVVE
jgi:hypothetical protein